MKRKRVLSVKALLFAVVFGVGGAVSIIHENYLLLSMISALIVIFLVAPIRKLQSDYRRMEDETRRIRLEHLCEVYEFCNMLLQAIVADPRVKESVIEFFAEKAPSVLGGIMIQKSMPAPSMAELDETLERMMEQYSELLERLRS